MIGNKSTISKLARPIHVALNAAGLQISRLKPKAEPLAHLSDQPTWIRQIIEKVTPYTMTSPERLASLCQAISYICKNDIQGDVVECGVWKGGSMMAAALALMHFGNTERSLFLFDTFDGMSEPTDADVLASTKEKANSLLLKGSKEKDTIWGFSPIEEVSANLQSLGYPKNKVILIKGKVEDTIPYSFPRPIALLRLDTDWYESTKHELKYLYPLLVTKGPLIIDDYGHWEGARRAVDEYIEAERLPLLLNRIDYTGRIAIKP
jgi:O-methyltransferase